jgi:hypothetical protein
MSQARRENCWFAFKVNFVIMEILFRNTSILEKRWEWQQNKVILISKLEKTEKHQENEVNDEEFNWNNVKRGNLKYW